MVRLPVKLLWLKHLTTIHTLYIPFTETRSEFQNPACAGNGYRKATAQIPADDDIIYLDSMTLPDQSQTEVRRLTTSLTKPNVNVNIGCWNVRTLYSIGKSAQLAR